MEVEPVKKITLTEQIMQEIASHFRTIKTRRKTSK